MWWFICDHQRNFLAFWKQQTNWLSLRWLSSWTKATMLRVKLCMIPCSRLDTKLRSVFHHRRIRSSFQLDRIGTIPGGNSNSEHQTVEPASVGGLQGQGPRSRMPRLSNRFSCTSHNPSRDSKLTRRHKSWLRRASSTLPQQLPILRLLSSSKCPDSPRWYIRDRLCHRRGSILSIEASFFWK